MLLSVDAEGSVHVLAHGTFPLITLKLADVLQQTAAQRIAVDTAVSAGALSRDLRQLALLCNDAASQQGGVLSLAVLDTSILADRSIDLQKLVLQVGPFSVEIVQGGLCGTVSPLLPLAVLAPILGETSYRGTRLTSSAAILVLQASHINSLLEDAEDSLRQSEAKWALAMKHVGDKWALLRKLLADHASTSTPKKDFSTLLACGVPSAAMQHFLSATMGKLLAVCQFLTQHVSSPPAACLRSSALPGHTLPPSPIAAAATCFSTGHLPRP